MEVIMLLLEERDNGMGTPEKYGREDRTYEGKRKYL